METAFLAGAGEPIILEGVYEGMYDEEALVPLFLSWTENTFLTAKGYLLSFSLQKKSLFLCQRRFFLLSAPPPSSLPAVGEPIILDGVYEGMYDEEALVPKPHTLHPAHSPVEVARVLGLGMEVGGSGPERGRADRARRCLRGHVR